MGRGSDRDGPFRGSAAPPASWNTAHSSSEAVVITLCFLWLTTCPDGSAAPQYGGSTHESSYESTTRKTHQLLKPHSLLYFTVMHKQHQPKPALACMFPVRRPLHRFFEVNKVVSAAATKNSASSNKPRSRLRGRAASPQL